MAASVGISTVLASEQGLSLQVDFVVSPADGRGAKRKI